MSFYAAMDFLYVILLLLAGVGGVLGDTIHQTMVTPTPYGAGLPGATFSCIRSNPDTNIFFGHNRVLNLNIQGFMAPNSTSLPSGTHVDHGTSTLTWELPPSGEYAGIFRCGGVNNGLETDVYSIVHGVERKFDWADGLVTKTVNIGENVSLSVQSVNGGSNPQWYRQDTGLIVRDSYTLHLTAVTQSQSEDGDFYVVSDPSADFTYGHLAMLRLIVRGCKEGKWGPPDCQGKCDSCYNGGVCDDDTGECICAPGFRGTNCLTACGKHMFGWFCEYGCGPGHFIKSCTGTHFGLPDPYGISCISGYTGRECNIECTSGAFGAGCTQICRCLSGTCDPFTGVCTGQPTGCQVGWHGTNCQEMCPAGYYGELCDKQCLCSNQTHCFTHTADCNVVTPEPQVNIVVITASGGSALVFIIILCIALCVWMKIRNTKRHERDQEMSPNVNTGTKSTEPQRLPVNQGHDDYDPVCQEGQNYMVMGMSGYPSLPYSRVNVGLPEWASQFSIPWEDMIVGNKVLGNGHYGDVLDGAVKVKGEIYKATIKKLKAQKSNADRHNFLKAFRVMAKLPRHPNVVALVGATQDDASTMYVACEYMPNGDLCSYLRNCRSTESNAQSTKLKDLMEFAVEVARGMDHLAKHKVIHCDLAARNVLLDESLVAKISNFGLLQGEDVYAKMISKTTDSIHWMAVESMTKQKFSSKSDVWSFGVLLWEIVTLGETPYSDIEPGHIVHDLLNGYRLPKPDNCPQKLFDLMSKCWLEDPTRRPSFHELVNRLTSIASNPIHFVPGLFTSDNSYTNFQFEYDDN